MAQSVERVLGKDEVTGSNPVSSSKAESYHESGRILLFNALLLKIPTCDYSQVGRFIR